MKPFASCVFMGDSGKMELPTPIGLLQETGVIGQILRQLPRAALDEAEAQNDPWNWLAKWVQKNPVERWPGSFRKTFEAAASQRQAILRLVEVARGGGSISQSWRLQMHDAQMSGDQKVADHWADKVTASILRWEKGRQWLLEDKIEGLSAPPGMREVAHAKYEKFYAADVRRSGKTEADKKWKSADDTRTPVAFKRDTIGEKITAALALRWMSVEDTGFPGFAFISDKVLAALLGLTLPLPSLLPMPDDPDNLRGRKMIEDCRRDIGLKKAEPLVVGLKHIDARKWAILDEDGEIVGYFNQAVSLPPKLAG